ncbi:S8/S53 family peptidase [Solirubrobacter phytolaccae]|uniref:S8/S53 family peptidase n=1 Tax=Solirubrobacter phytolaccae TaxID=1404360 RepID=A0A9X3N708_9ACTN|nr:S8/S53 family peptidase [Solirubrobacter phytolaccae]MDA0179640.1 S8/S53 family peptidase [Solirubrobacter phytolaccae]
MIDTGVTPMPGLDTQLVERISVVGDDVDDVMHTPANPFSGHGTFVAKMITELWPAAKIISVRAFKTATNGALAADYQSAVSECIQPPRRTNVITLALGTSQGDLARLENKIVNAHEYFGVNVIAAAGNDGNANSVDYPARFSASLAVGATEASGSFCAFSNRGEGLDLGAPGCPAHVTAFDGRLGAFRGTSFAVPSVAAVLVALRSYRPELTSDQAERLLLSPGRVLDAAAVFKAAGLKVPSPPGAAAPDATPSPMVVDRRPDRPQVRRLTLRRGTLRIEVGRPPHGGRTVFRVGTRSYPRRNGKLRLKVRSWRPVTVFTEDEWGVRSPALRIRR